MNCSYSATVSMAIQLQRRRKNYSGDYSYCYEAPLATPYQLAREQVDGLILIDVALHDLEASHHSDFVD